MTNFGFLGLLGFMLVIFQLICLISSQYISPGQDVQCLQTTSQELKDPDGNLYSTWNFRNTTKGFICNFLGITCWHSDDNKVLSISLQDMGLQGEFPSGVRYCTSMTSLSLSQNRLTGSIPKELCQWLPFLVTIDLSHNQFTGPIPAELHNCTYLSILHLNGNQLTGEIPWLLTRLDRLKDFNVANNKLTGNIPSFGHNINARASNFQGNPGLCGPPLKKACGSTNESVNPMVVAAFLLIAIVLIVWILLGLGWMISKAKFRRSLKILPSTNVPNDWQKYVRARRSVKVCSFEMPIRKMRLADLVALTNNFSEDNIVLHGRTGIIYKAKLPDQSFLAVKRLRPCSVETEKDFKCEMKALAHLRHRNLVPLLGYCIADEEKLLVYKYMGKGTLLNCLHGVQGEQHTLDLGTRLKICIGTARGLAWLHHSCNPHVVHRNISSGIIFLDEEYEAHISGFGLARLLNAKDTCAPISSCGEDDQLVEEFGYDAPEVWRNSGVATLKGDVYSFGILVLEIITGLRPCDTVMDEESRREMTFLEWIHGRFAREGDCVEQAIQNYCANEITVSSDEWIRRLFADEGIHCTVEPAATEISCDEGIHCTVEPAATEIRCDEGIHCTVEPAATEISCDEGIHEMGAVSSSDEWTRRLYAADDQGIHCAAPTTQSCYANQIGVLAEEESSVVAEVMRVAFRCVNYHPDGRPSMYEVYKWLTKIGERYGSVSGDDSDR